MGYEEGVSDACDECGWAEAGGREACRARFEAFLARDFSDPLYFRAHRMFVDAYCLQHPEQYCASAKSLAAHLGGLCWIIEEGASTAVGPDALRRWLSGERSLSKPAIPAARGAITIGNLPTGAAAVEWAQAVRRWSEAVWVAYEPLHPVARAWIEAAQSAVRSAPRSGSGRSDA